MEKWLLGSILSQLLRGAMTDGQLSGVARGRTSINRQTVNDNVFGRLSRSGAGWRKTADCQCVSTCY